MKSKFTRTMISLIFWLGIWFVCYYAVGRDLLIASPVDVIKKLEIMTQHSFWQCVMVSLLRTIEAYAFGIVAACILAVLCTVSSIADMLIKPAMSVIRATPVASFIILALVWLKADKVPILAGMLMVIPVVFSSVCEGIRSVDPNLIELTDVYRWKLRKKIFKLYIPSIFPSFIASCEACIGLCFKATIAAEVIGTPKLAIGSQLYSSKIYLETDGVMAWTIVIIILSIVMEKLLKMLIGRGVKNAYRHE